MDDLGASAGNPIAYSPGGNSRRAGMARNAVVSPNRARSDGVFTPPTGNPRLGSAIRGSDAFARHSDTGR